MSAETNPRVLMAVRTLIASKAWLVTEHTHASILNMLEIVMDGVGDLIGLGSLSIIRKGQEIENLRRD